MGKWSKKDRCPGFVYVFDLGFDDLYKIGWTKNVPRRLKALRAANPRLQEVLSGKVGHAKRVEDELHQLYQEQRKERELFRLSKNDIVEIRRYLKVNKPKRKYHYHCKACGKDFTTINKHYLLCAACVRKAYKLFQCPFCGNPIVGERKGKKPTCKDCTIYKER